MGRHDRLVRDLPEGHRFEEDTEVLEFSARAEYQETIDVVARNVAAMQAKG